jgi:uracil-DNA glycosylase
MGLHTQLDVYKTAYDLVGLVVDDLIRNMPRDVKKAIGERLRDECINLTVLIQAANMERQSKAPHLVELVKSLGVVELLLRISRDKRYIATGKYAAAALLTTSIGKQANAWRKSPSASPAA